jgi:catechol 2,3-dioxygenase-like lactoylglutathione lyase family enzyme
MSGFDAHITFCYTADLATTARFYEDVLGLELALDQGRCRIYRVAGDAYLGFCTRTEAARPDGIILTFVTADVDGWHARLVERGVPIEKPPTRHAGYDLYHCFVRDPNGYLVELQRFDDPRWTGSGRE